LRQALHNSWMLAAECAFGNVKTGTVNNWPVIGAEAGFDLHLVKPPDPRELENLLRDVADVLRIAAGV
jgi:hypothetical protein